MISMEVDADGRQLLQRHQGDLLTNTMPILLDHEPGMTGTYLQKPLPTKITMSVNRIWRSTSC